MTGEISELGYEGNVNINEVYNNESEVSSIIHYLTTEKFWEVEKKLTSNFQEWVKGAVTK